MSLFSSCTYVIYEVLRARTDFGFVTIPQTVKINGRYYVILDFSIFLSEDII